MKCGNIDKLKGGDDTYDCNKYILTNMKG